MIQKVGFQQSFLQDRTKKQNVAFGVELRINLSRKFVRGIRHHYPKDSKPNAEKIMTDALTFYNWVIEKSAEGRLVSSCDEAGQNLHRLSTLSIEKARLYSARQ